MTVECMDFQALVRSFTFKYQYRFKNQTTEDIEQELWCKVLQVLPTIDWERFNKSQVFAYMSKSLKSYTNDLSRKNDPRKNYILGDFDCFDVSKITTEEIDRVYGLISKPAYPSPSTVIKFKELKKHIYNWLSRKDEKTKIFITQCITPTKEIRQRWAELAKSYPPKYKNFDKPPIHTLAKLLGMTQSEYMKIINSLRRYLIGHGYLELQPA